MQQPYWRFLATEAGYGRHRAPPALVRRWKKQAREARDRARLVRQMFRPAKPGCYNTIHVVEHGGVFVRQSHTDCIFVGRPPSSFQARVIPPAYFNGQRMRVLHHQPGQPI